MLSRTSYDNVKYTHQGWFSKDHNVFYFGDEYDEHEIEGITTTTFVLNVQDLQKPRLVGRRAAPYKAIDHNMYLHNDYLYQANYAAGLRVLRAKANMTHSLEGFDEVAFFDVYPEHNDATFVGSWSVYPFFPSGTIVVSSIDRGLFVLKADTSGPVIPGSGKNLGPGDSKPCTYLIIPPHYLSCINLLITLLIVVCLFCTAKSPTLDSSGHCGTGRQLFAGSSCK